MSTCPTFDVLDALAAGHDVPDDVRSHVTRCSRCAEFLRSARFGQRFGDVLCERKPDRDRGVPQVFGYDVLSEIAGGGQGTVYRAMQITTGQVVAIKVLRSLPGGPSRQSRERFAREIQIVGSLSHPGIARLFDSLTLDDGREALVMELVEGVPLDAWMTPVRRADTRLVLELLADIADAVHHAHQRGIIHRDLKPSNILIDASGKPHLLDFGIAKHVDPSLTAVPITRTGEFTGTLAYAAPEQVSALSDAPDIRTDLYALGVIGYEAVVGSMPYDVQGSLETTINSILTQHPPPRTVAGVAVDPWTVLTKTMAKEPHRRYQSAAELARDLRHAARGQAIDARGDSRWYLLRKGVRRHRGPITVGSAVLLGLAGVLVALAVGNTRLSGALRESRLRQVRAHIAAEGRERAEQVLWSEFDRLVPRGLDAERTLWSAPLAQRELLWCFVEMQTRAMCLDVLYGGSSLTAGVSARTDGGFSVITPDRGFALLSIEGDRLVAGGATPLAPETGVMLPMPSGRYVLARQPEGLAVIDPEAGGSVHRLRLEGTFRSIAGLPVADWGFAMTTGDGAMQVLSLPDLTPLARFDGLLDWQTPWLDPNRRVVAFITKDNELQVADLDTGETARPLPDPVTLPSPELAFPQLLMSPDGSTLLLAHGGGILARSIHDPASRAVLMAHPGYRMRVSNDPAWTLLSASAHGDPTLHLWDTSDWSRLPGLTGHRGTVISHAFSKDGSRIITTDAAGTVRLWAAPGHGWRTSYGPPTSRCHQIAHDSASDGLFAADSRGVVHDYRSDGQATVIQTDGSTMEAARTEFDAAGRTLAIAGLASRVAFVSMPADVGHPGRSVDLGARGAVSGMRFRPSGDRSPLAVCADGGYVVLIDPISATISAETALPAGGAPSELCWSGDGSLLAVTRRDGSLLVLGADSLEVVRTVKLSDTQLRCAVFLPDGRTIAAAGDSGTLLTYDLRTGMVTESARFSEHSLFTVDCHPAGSVLAAGSRSGVVTLLDVATGRELASLDAGGAVMSLRFSEDGDSLFVAALERPVERWDLTELAGTLPRVRPKD